jgi:hypothetical protein
LSFLFLEDSEINNGLAALDSDWTSDSDSILPQTTTTKLADADKKR